jgi:hypothetical protein
VAARTSVNLFDGTAISLFTAGGFAGLVEEAQSELAKAGNTVA